MKMTVTNKRPCLRSSFYLLERKAVQCFLKPAIHCSPKGVLTSSGVAKKNTLSDKGAGAWGRIMAVRDENAISMVWGGNT